MPCGLDSSRVAFSLAEEGENGTKMVRLPGRCPALMPGRVRLAKCQPDQEQRENGTQALPEQQRVALQ